MATETIELRQGGNGVFKSRTVDVASITATEIRIFDSGKVRRFMRRTGYERGGNNGFGFRPEYIPQGEIMRITAKRITANK